MADPTEPVVLGGDSYYQDPEGFFARLRESRPVAAAVLPDGRRAWLLTRYADVRAALADPRLAKDVHRWPGGARSRPSEAEGLHAHVLNRDPPDHTRLRRVVQTAFTPRRVAALRPRTEEIAAGLAGNMAEECDLIAEYASPLPVTVLCELLEVPAADRGWISAAVRDYNRPGEAERVNRAMAAYLTDLIAARRAAPGADLISALIQADKHEHLNGPKLLSTVFQLIMAGFDTTVNLIANGILALLTHPAEMSRLRDDPSLLPAAVEELLRFGNPLVHATDRFTTDDVTIGGTAIPAGEWVCGATMSANLDPDRFPDPGRLDLGRDTGAHVSFGYGIHYCAGAPLARMEGEVALGALLARFPRLSLAVAPEELRWRRVGLMHGLESLPVRLARGC